MITHTFVQPVGKSVEDDSFHPRGGDSQRVTPHVGLVVDVILKNVDLRERREEGIYCTLWHDFYELWSSLLSVCSSFWSVFLFDFLSDEILFFHIKAGGLSHHTAAACVYSPSFISVLIFAFDQTDTSCMFNNIPKSVGIHFYRAWRAFLLFGVIYFSALFWKSIADTMLSPNGLSTNVLAFWTSTSCFFGPEVTIPWGGTRKIDVIEDQRSLGTEGNTNRNIWLENTIKSCKYSKSYHTEASKVWKTTRKVKNW